MPSRRPKPEIPRTEPEPSGLLGDAEPTASALAEGLRRAALALTAALIVARAYWPAEYRVEADSGSGLLWALAMMMVAAVAIVAMWLEGGPRVRLAWADLGVVGLVTLVGLSASRAASRRIAINFAWEWVGVGIAYLLIRNLPRSRGESRAVASALVLTAVTLAIYGLLQIGFEHPELRDAYRKDPRATLAQMGADPNLAADDPERRRLEDRLLGSREPNATFALANTLAGVLVGPSVVLLALVQGLMARRDARTRLPLSLAALPLIVLLAVLLLTKSRSAYLGLAVAMLVLALRARKRVSPRAIVLGSFGLALALGALIAAGVAAGQLDRQVVTEATKSLTYRVEYWRGAWGVIGDGPGRWWSGVGPGNFSNSYLKHKLPQSSEEIADPHNLILDVWATAGLPAVLALLLALGAGLRSLLAPPRHELNDANNAEQGPTTWLVVTAGLGGWVLVVALGRINPFQEDLQARWAVLGVGWLASGMLLGPLLRRNPITSPAAGLGVLAIVVNLLAAGGIAFAPVSLMLFGLLGLGLNLREDRGVSRLRPVGGREFAFVLAALIAAAIGTFFGTVSPFWNARSAIESAEASLVGVIAEPEKADAFYRQAVAADRYGADARILRANLEYREWQRRGRPADDLSWHRIDSGLRSALEPPLNPDNLMVHRLRARIAREYLDLPNLLPAERHRIQSDRLDACRKACDLYPTDASLRADLAEAYAGLDRFREATEEAREALALDEATPHVDRKLRAAVRERLKGSLAVWQGL